MFMNVTLIDCGVGVVRQQGNWLATAESRSYKASSSDRLLDENDLSHWSFPFSQQRSWRGSSPTVKEGSLLSIGLKFNWALLNSRATAPRRSWLSTNQNKRVFVLSSSTRLLAAQQTQNQSATYLVLIGLRVERTSLWSIETRLVLLRRHSSCCFCLRKSERWMFLHVAVGNSLDVAENEEKLAALHFSNGRFCKSQRLVLPGRKRRTRLVRLQRRRIHLFSWKSRLLPIPSSC
jgi:hypothetical protein